MNTGSLAFIFICTGLVFFMVPGLAFFYGGLDGVKMSSIP